jgi:hypothetical protein
VDPIPGQVKPETIILVVVTRLSIRHYFNLLAIVSTTKTSMVQLRRDRCVMSRCCIAATLLTWH